MHGNIHGIRNSIHSVAFIGKGDRKMAKKEKQVAEMSEYTKSVHKIGRFTFLLAYVFILGFPVAICVFFNAWPTWKQFIGAAVGVVPLYWSVGIIEAFSYMPLLGPGGSYLGFITGNVSNLKVPVAIKAMDSVDAKQGTEEGDVISTIAIAVSSIVTVFIVMIFVVLMVPLTPVFTNPVLNPAFNNVVPALFGGLMIAFVSKDSKVGIPILILGCALFIAVPSLASVYPIIMPIIAGIAVLYARILYKKGKL